jgi:Flp pilus assembly protein TadG
MSMMLAREQQKGPIRGSGTPQEGAVLVEFALVLPLLLVLLLGLVEFGRAFNYWIDETHLANVAARWAAVNKNPGPGGTLALSVLSEADVNQLKEGPEPAEVCIGLLNGSAKVGEPVEAKVTYDFNWMPFISLEALNGITSTTLTGSATMRIERESTEYTTLGPCP